MEKKKNNLMRRIGQNSFFRDYTMLFVLILLIIVAMFVSDKFLTFNNIMNVLKQYAAVGIVSLGVTIVTIGGTRDLAVGSLVSLTGALAARLIPAVGQGTAILIALGVGMLVGLITGGIIAGTRADMGDSFIITFGLLSVFFAIAMLITGGFTVSVKNADFFVWLGNGMIFKKIPVTIIFFFLLAVILNFFLRKTKVGRQIYYMGSNITAARLAGIKVEKLRVLMYTLSGTLTAFAGVILAARTRNATGSMGLNYEMDVLAAVAIGGVNLYGGGGTIWNTVIGVFIMAVLSNIFSMLGLSQEIKMMAQGTIIILAVSMENVKRSNAGVL